MKFYCKKCDKQFAVKTDAPEGVLVCPECGADCGKFNGELGEGIVINDFLIEKLLSKGGMGEVFLARQISLDRQVALKVLQQKFINDKEYVDSLFREARAAAKLNHPNIVQAYAVGEEDGIFYFAMEFVRGKTFKEILKEEGKVSFVQSAKVIRDIASALGVAWREQKLVHQDIKPDNIMLDSNGFAKLADLGLAKSATTGQVEEDSDEVLGTPQYISPEQLTGIPTDVRSDIYSLGATFFHFVTGRFAYVAPTAEEITKMHVAGNLEPPKKFNSELPDELNAIIMKMMARYPEERYQTPEPLIKDLDDYLRNANDKEESAAPKIKLKGLKINKKADEASAAHSEGTAAARPSVSVKPTLSMKSAVPGKPATPAKPVVPAKPATPARPVVPAKPVVPSKPVATEKPADDSSKSAGEKKEAAAVETPAVENKTASTVSNKNKSKTKLTLIVAASVIVLLVIAAAAMVILEKSGKCPDALKFIAEPLAAMIPDNNGGGKPVAAADAVGKKEVKPAGPVTRDWYVKKCSELVDMYVNNQSEKNKFLEQVDAAWLTICQPETAEEKAAFENLCKTFAGIDEYFRNSAAREELAKQHLDKIAAVVQKRVEEARRQEEYQAQQQRLREERERLERENEARRIAEAEKEQQIYNELKKQISGLKEELAYGIICAAVKNDFSAVEKVSEEIAKMLQTTVFVTDRENALKQDLMRFNREWKSEVDKLSKIKNKVEKISEKNSVQVIFSFGNVYIVSCKPGDIRYRDRNDKILKLNLDQLSVRDRNMFYITLERRRGITNPAFVLGLLNNNVKSSDVPAGFWKRNWQIFEKALKRF